MLYSLVDHLEILFSAYGTKHSSIGLKFFKKLVLHLLLFQHLKKGYIWGSSFYIRFPTICAFFSWSCDFQRPAIPLILFLLLNPLPEPTYHHVLLKVGKELTYFKWFKVCFVGVSSSVNLSRSSKVSAMLYDLPRCLNKAWGEVECFIRQQDHNPSAIRRVKHNLPALNCLKFVLWVLLVFTASIHATWSVWVIGEKVDRGPEHRTPGKHTRCAADPIWAQVSSIPEILIVIHRMQGRSGVTWWSCEGRVVNDCEIAVVRSIDCGCRACLPGYVVGLLASQPLLLFCYEHISRQVRYIRKPVTTRLWCRKGEHTSGMGVQTT